LHFLTTLPRSCIFFCLSRVLHILPGFSCSCISCLVFLPGFPVLDWLS
jgi:hypothetical protein